MQENKENSENKMAALSYQLYTIRYQLIRFDS